MVSSTDGWILWNRNYDRIQLYHYDGVSWSLAQTLGHNQAIIRADLEMVSADDGWIVIGGPLSGSSNLAESAIFRWNGTAWTKFAQVTAPNAVSLAAIDMLSPSQGWATGAFNFGNIYYEWNGSDWNQSYLGWLGTNTFGGDDFAMVSPTDGWAIGLGGVARWNGVDWIDQVAPVRDAMNAIHMIDANNGWIVGGGPGYDPSTGQSFDIPGYIFHWNGSAWNEVDSPVTDRLLDIDMVAADNGWIVGENGVILHWDGSAWSQVAGPGPYHNNAIDLLASGQGWIAGNNGVLTLTVQPELMISDTLGAPGSFFTLTGQDFPAGETAAIVVNGQQIGNIAVDQAGAFTLVISTATADEGRYSATARVNPAATAIFTLDSGAPTLPQQGDRPVLDLPGGLGMTELVFLPGVSR